VLNCKAGGAIFLPFGFSVHISRVSDVSENIRTLNSKLTAPHNDGTIIRERLLSLLNQSAKKKLTMIVAGAGYGKTTLAAQAISRSDVKTIWYRLDESDADFIIFFNYLVAGIRQHYPEFGVATLRSLKETHSDIVTIFLSEIEDAVKEDIVIVLDDFHSVKDGHDISEAVGKFLRDLSPFIHLILISRSEPDFPLSRPRAMREVIDITEEDIVFTAAEIEKLYSEIFGFSLARSDIHAVCHKIGGWISGLILLCHSLKGKSSDEIGQNLLNLQGSQRAIFTYLEENIYGSLSSEQQNFLIRTSILPRITAKFCDRLLNINNSSDILKYLENNHLFTTSVEEAGQCYYSYHQLFRDFLQSRLRNESDQESLLRLHRDAAVLSEKSGDEDEAVRQYLMAEEFKRACDLLNHGGKRLFAEGRFQLLSSYLDKIPSDTLTDYPWIIYLQGQLAGLRGKHRQAVGYYDNALNCFFQRKDEEGVQSCLIESGLICFQTGNLKEAQQRFQELLEQNHLELRLRIEVLGYLIYISSHFGNMSLADRCSDEAITLINSETGDSDDKDLRQECLKWIYSYRGYRYAFSGDFAKVLEIVAFTKAISQNSERVGYPPAFYVLESMAYCGLQRYSEGFETAGQTLRSLKEASAKSASGWHSPRLSLRGGRGFPDPFASWVLAYSAYCAAELGKISDALKDAEESLKSFSKMNCRLGEAFAYSVLHRVNIKSGNTGAAEQWARVGLEAIRGLTMPRIETRLKLDLAESLTEKGESQEALKLLAEADKGIMSDYDVVRSKYLYARLHRSDKQNSERSASPPGLQICLLGKFRVLIDVCEIPDHRWKSRRAKTLFQFLAHSRLRGSLNKEVLMELLWPEEDPELTAKRFHVALASLRKTLEPNIVRGVPSSYIFRIGDSYRIEVGEQGWVDTEKFASELRQAREESDPEKAIVHFSNAESLYVGDFLEEEIFSDWCYEIREKTKDAYLSALRQIIAYYEHRGSIERCIAYAEKYLETDRYAEDIYRALMIFYRKIGDKSRMTRTFERCRDKIMKELNCALSEETEELYRKLLSTSFQPAFSA
jgi:ATP/maltotriose-dependent transcriptional regulator MalT/DNA-binding SARP family transcriptional activator